VPKYQELYDRRDEFYNKRQETIRDRDEQEQIECTFKPDLRSSHNQFREDTGQRQQTGDLIERLDSVRSCGAPRALASAPSRTGFHGGPGRARTAPDGTFAGPGLGSGTRTARPTSSGSGRSRRKCARRRSRRS
jgi:hypothetical protein